MSNNMYRIRSGLRKQHGILEPPENEDQFDVMGNEHDEPSWGVKVSSLSLSTDHEKYIG